MDRENAGSRIGVSNPNWPCLCSKNFTFACFMIPENSNKLYFKSVMFPGYTESIMWHDRHMLICVAIIKSGVTMVCINKRSSDCAIFDVHIAMISMLRVYLFLLFDFSVCLYHKYITYANLSYMHADFANQNFRLPLYERRKFLIIIFLWCSINGNANLSRRKEKQLTVHLLKRVPIHRLLLNLHLYAC